MRRFSPLLLCLTLAPSGLAACGDDVEPSPVAQEIPGFVIADAAATLDTPGPGTGTLPPDFGDPCDGNEDCSTGWCVEGPSGFVCSKACLETCPDGWSCKGVTSGSVDVVFLCLPNGTPDLDAGGGPVDAAGGADTPVLQTDGGQGDASPPLVSNLCESTPGDGIQGFKVEPAGGDFPDCITGCGHAAQIGFTELDLRSQAGADAPLGIRGTIDGNVHTYPIGPGPDIDVLTVRADPRAMVELAIQELTQGSSLEPLVYTSDGFAVRTWNSDVAPGNTCARTVVGFPYVSQTPIFVAIEDAVNYDLYTPSGYQPGTVGGTGYGYAVRARVTPFAPTELGNVAPGTSVQRQGEVLTAGGDLRYYRLWAPGNAKTTVTIARAPGASSEFVVLAAGMKTVAGELIWQKSTYDDDADGMVQLDATAFRPCVPPSECSAGFECPEPLCGSDLVEFIFAVSDYNGAAAPGIFAFGFQATVQ